MGLSTHTFSNWQQDIEQGCRHSVLVIQDR
jgi:hypothetical protein